MATAVDFAHRQLEAAYACQANSLAMRLLLGLASIHYENAQLTDTADRRHNHRQVAHHGVWVERRWSHCILGWAHYQRNELAAAEQCFRNARRLAHAAHGRAVVDGYTGLVLTALAQGRPHDALAIDRHAARIAAGARACWRSARSPRRSNSVWRW